MIDLGMTVDCGDPWITGHLSRTEAEQLAHVEQERLDAYLRLIRERQIPTPPAKRGLGSGAVMTPEEGAAGTT